MVLLTASGVDGCGVSELESLADQLAGVEVHDAALDAASAHVDAEPPTL